MGRFCFRIPKNDLNFVAYFAGSCTYIIPNLVSAIRDQHVNGALHLSLLSGEGSRQVRLNLT